MHQTKKVTSPPLNDPADSLPAPVGSTGGGGTILSTAERLLAAAKCEALNDFSDWLEQQSKLALDAMGKLSDSSSGNSLDRYVSIQQAKTLVFDYKMHCKGAAPFIRGEVGK